MSQITEGSLLWEPSAAVKEDANLTHYMKWLAKHKGLSFDSYPTLWQWSGDQIGPFWESIWEYFNIKASKPAEMTLADKSMPGAKWFVGAELNYAENILAKMTSERPMMLYKAEDEPLIAVSWQEIYEKTKRVAQALREIGVKRGDRVVAYMPNMPETIVAVLAASSLGAIWSSCSPDFGPRSVLDRFTQIEPKVLIAVDGYNYNGKTFDRRAVVAELQASLPTLEKTILVTHVANNTDGLTNTVLWDDQLAHTTAPAELTFEQVPFDHPLWVLYSSGTTGLPKPIVHGHGGVLLEHVKATAFHNDLKASDRFFWYSSTGWMMWNYIVGSLLSGATIILYNGAPAYPDMNALWQLAGTPL